MKKKKINKGLLSTRTLYLDHSYSISFACSYHKTRVAHERLFCYINEKVAESIGH